jgi:uncharacterized protein (DUF1330 family)
MTAFLVGEFEVTNPAGLAPYRDAVTETIAKYGGRFVVRGGTTTLKEGEPEPKYIVIVEFPDTATLDRWYNSPEYQRILPARLGNATGRVFTVVGVKQD